MEKAENSTTSSEPEIVNVNYEQSTHIHYTVIQSWIAIYDKIIDFCNNYF